MKLKTFSIKEEEFKLEALRTLSKETGLSVNFLIRTAIYDLLKHHDTGKLKNKLFNRYGEGECG